MDIVQKVSELDALFFLEEEHTPEDLNFLFETLFHPNLQAAINSAVILGRLDKPIILHLMNDFELYSVEVQKTLILFFASTEFYESYEFLIKQLAVCQSEDCLIMLLHCLIHTEYFVLPLLLLYLSDPNQTMHWRLRIIMSKMGFSRLKPMLLKFPELPHEGILRDIFGDEAIQSLGLNRIT